MKKMVQVFLAGATTQNFAEVSAELVGQIEFRTPWVVVRTKEEQDVTDHYFPVGQVRMIRVFDEKEGI